MDAASLEFVKQCTKLSGHECEQLCLDQGSLLDNARKLAAKEESAIHAVASRSKNNGEELLEDYESLSEGLTSVLDMATSAVKQLSKPGSSKGLPQEPSRKTTMAKPLTEVAKLDLAFIDEMKTILSGNEQDEAGELENN